MFLKKDMDEMECCKGRYGQKRSILNEDVYKNGVF